MSQPSHQAALKIHFSKDHIAALEILANVRWEDHATGERAKSIGHETKNPFDHFLKATSSLTPYYKLSQCWNKSYTYTWNCAMTFYTNFHHLMVLIPFCTRNFAKICTHIKKNIDIVWKILQLLNLCNLFTSQLQSFLDLSINSINFQFLHISKF